MENTVFMSYYNQPKSHKGSKKKINQEYHSKKRAMERYGVVLNVDEVVSLIQHGQSRPLKRTNNRLTIHRVFYQDVEMDVVYDGVRKTLSTVLPRKEYE